MITVDSVVEGRTRKFGRFSTTPTRANPLDEFRGVRRVFEGFRLKEWAGFTLSHPDLFSSMIMQDAKYLASSEFYAYDRASGDLVQHAGSALGGSLALSDDLLHSRVAFAAKGYRIGYDFRSDSVRVRVRIDATGSTPAVTGDLVLDPTKASPPLVVSAPLAGGTMYTNKIVYPASGQLTCGQRTYEFDPERDVAMLDEHKSRLPYHTWWTWGSFAFRIPQGYAGANFAARDTAPGAEEESCLWTPEAAEPLSDITFTPTSSRELAPWTIQSADRRLDVVFTPEGRKEVDHNFAVVGLRYFQMFGSYTGTLRGTHETWKVDGVHGVCEDMRARM
jgi:hypothetical protein